MASKKLSLLFTWSCYCSVYTRGQHCTKTWKPTKGKPENRGLWTKHTKNAGFFRGGVHFLSYDSASCALKTTQALQAQDINIYSTYPSIFSTQKQNHHFFYIPPFLQGALESLLGSPLLHCRLREHKWPEVILGASRPMGVWNQDPSTLQSIHSPGYMILASTLVHLTQKKLYFLDHKVPA